MDSTFLRLVRPYNNKNNNNIKIENNVPIKGATLIYRGIYVSANHIYPAYFVNDLEFTCSAIAFRFYIG